MYFITTLNPDDSRCVGYYSTLEKATQVVQDNCYDLYEAGCYPHAVIEYVEEGIYHYDFNPTWFTYNKITHRYEKSDRPPYVEDNSIGFGIG